MLTCTPTRSVLANGSLCLLLATSTSHVSPHFAALNASLTQLVTRFDWTRVALNLYLPGADPMALALHPHVTAFAVAGFKSLFWKRVLTPAAVASFTHVFLFDDDMRVAPGEFQLVALLRLQEHANVSLIAPAPIGTGRGLQKADHTRGDRRQSYKTREQADELCALRWHTMVELKAPLFTALAWRLVHTQLLGRIADKALVGPVIDRYWCGLLEHRITGCDAHLRLDPRRRPPQHLVGQETRPTRETTFVNATCRARLGSACAYSYITPMRHDNHKSLVADFGMPTLDDASGSRAATELRSDAAAAHARHHHHGAPAVQHYDQRVVKAAIDRAGLAPYAWAQPSWHPAGTSLQARVGRGSFSGCWGFDALSAPLGGGAWSSKVHERMHREASEAEAREAKEMTASGEGESKAAGNKREAKSKKAKKAKKKAEKLSSGPQQRTTTARRALGDEMDARGCRVGASARYAQRSSAWCDGSIVDPVPMAVSRVPRQPQPQTQPQPQPQTQPSHGQRHKPPVCMLTPVHAPNFGHLHTRIEATYRLAIGAPPTTVVVFDDAAARIAYCGRYRADCAHPEVVTLTLASLLWPAGYARAQAMLQTGGWQKRERLRDAAFAARDGSAAETLTQTLAKSCPAKFGVRRSHHSTSRVHTRTSHLSFLTCVRLSRLGCGFCVAHRASATRASRSSTAPPKGLDTAAPTG